MYVCMNIIYNIDTNFKFNLGNSVKKKKKKLENFQADLCYYLLNVNSKTNFLNMTLDNV